jgi:Protein of unknown function (DUF4012)
LRVAGALRGERRGLLFVGILALAAGSLVVSLQARGDVAKVERDLDEARSLLGQASRLEVDTAGQRQALSRRAQVHVLAARRRLHGWPLGALSATPILCRDVRAAEAVTDAALETARAAGRVAAALGSVERRPSSGSISAVATALLDLSAVLRDGAEHVEQAKTLLASGAKRRFLAEARSAEATSTRAGRSLQVAADLYGPRGSRRYFLAFQNPAELRGTGGLIGEYGVLEASPSGPVVHQVRPMEELRRRLRGSVSPPPGLPAQFRRFGVTRDWRSVNIPADLPTVGRMMVAMYQRSGGGHVDGVIMIDPLAMSRILRVSGPIEVEGRRVGSRTLVKTTLLTAYVRYQRDNDGRRRFLGQVGLQAARAVGRALAVRPVELLRALANAAQGRHLAVYASDPAVQDILATLGIDGSASAPDGVDYLMPVGVNAAANKADYFLRRELTYAVRLQPDGGARVRAAATLRNDAPARGLPRYVIGPFDGRFRPGENRILQSLYVANAYGFTRASKDNRRVRASADESFQGLALTQAVSISAGRSATIEYDLLRRAAVRVENGHIAYRLLVRPQPTVNPDLLNVAVSAPANWRFVQVPSGFAGDPSAVRWSGRLDRERLLEFILIRTA